MTNEKMAKYHIGELVYYKIGGTLKPENKEYGIIRMCKIVAAQCHIGKEWIYAVECPEYAVSCNNEADVKAKTVVAEECQLSKITNTDGK
jgi:hypothetical protein